MARVLRRLFVVLATLIAVLVLALWGASRFGVVQEMVRTRVLALLRASVEPQVDLGGVGGPPLPPPVFPRPRGGGPGPTAPPGGPAGMPSPAPPPLARPIP